MDLQMSTKKLKGASNDNLITITPSSIVLCYNVNTDYKFIEIRKKNLKLNKSRLFKKLKWLLKKKLKWLAENKQNLPWFSAKFEHEKNN